MSRYIKKFKSTIALGPTEERGFPLWAGYDIDSDADDLSAVGLVNVDDWSEEQLRERGVTSFTRVNPGDVALYAKLGIGKKSGSVD